MPLRSDIIRLAHENEILRPHLLQILAAEGDKDAEESEKEGRFPKGPEGEKEFAAWLKNQPQKVQDEWNSNKDKFRDKFKAAGEAERLFTAAVQRREAGCEKLPEGPMRDNCEKKKGDKGEDKGEDKDEDKGKEASLRAATIRLAHANEVLRPHLLRILADEG